jgi:hypothetical protein
MGLRHVYKKRFKGVTLKSGHFYRFKYQAWEHDPKPVIIFMASIEGIHQNSGHQWRIFQGLNFTYIPRAQRKRFLKVWMKELDKPGNIKFTWRKVLAKYPYLKPAIRRYFFKPNYYIRNLEEIPFDNIEKVVISTFSRDFSKKITTALLGKFKKALKARQMGKKKQKKRRKKK